MGISKRNAWISQLVDDWCIMIHDMVLEHGIGASFIANECMSSAHLCIEVHVGCSERHYIHHSFHDEHTTLHGREGALRYDRSHLS